jgi:hypothetical protein
MSISRRSFLGGSAVAVGGLALADLRLSTPIPAQAATSAAAGDTGPNGNIETAPSQTVYSSGTMTFDTNNGYIQYFELTANVSAIAFANWPNGAPGGSLATMEVWLYQDATGSRTMPWADGVGGVRFDADLTEQPGGAPNQLSIFYLRQTSGSGSSPNVIISAGPSVAGAP